MTKYVPYNSLPDYPVDSAGRRQSGKIGCIDRLPVFSSEQLAEYKRVAVDPLAGTSAGEAERRLYEGMKYAAKVGIELARVE